MPLLRGNSDSIGGYPISSIAACVVKGAWPVRLRVTCAKLYSGVEFFVTDPAVSAVPEQCVLSRTSEPRDYEWLLASRFEMTQHAALPVTQVAA